MSGYGIQETVTCPGCGATRQRELRQEPARRKQTQCQTCAAKARAARRREEVA